MDNVGSSLSVDKIPVTFSPGNSRAQSVHTMDYLEVSNGVFVYRSNWKYKFYPLLAK